ncbi:dimethyladenosine transferase 1 [Tropilaelaps mercedesae]|uniref:rRNA adenine N(6)-methyltransferase n=1 Tax=Tropilaelaps mercedesae TaxID=418985 RepID=A0A1V9XD58_9ACAR|nr:dimethyladenosine transferase 1 [Tropilaelaps mercedesae]
MSAVSRLAKQPLYRLPPLPTPADLLRFYRLRALKQLSQNFLLDPRICAKVVRSSGKLKGAHVIEVGPGPGCLTRPILEQGAESVVVIEKDRRFLPTLKLLADATNNRVKVVHGDVLLQELHNLIPPEKAEPWEGHLPNIHLIGNLPFSISTILIVRWMKMVSERTGAWKFGRTRMTLTFQKEVADRITCTRDNPERCRLSVLVQGYCYTKSCMEISGGSFVPPPMVNVGVVRVVPRIEPLFKQPFDIVEKVLRCLFNTKRKEIRNPIKNLVPENLRKDLVPEILKMANVDPEANTLFLDIEEFSRICDVYAKLCDEIPGFSGFDYRGNCNQRCLWNEFDANNATQAMLSK